MQPIIKQVICPIRGFSSILNCLLTSNSRYIDKLNNKINT